VDPRFVNPCQDGAGRYHEPAAGQPTPKVARNFKRPDLASVPTCAQTTRRVYAPTIALAVAGYPLWKSLSSTARVEAFVDRQQARSIDVGILLRGADIRMA